MFYNNHMPALLFSKYTKDCGSRTRLVVSGCYCTGLFQNFIKTISVAESSSYTYATGMDEAITN